MVLVLRVRARGLAELVVEEDAADPGDVREDAVEDLFAGLVSVETLADEIAEIAAALRDADGKSRADGRARLGRSGAQIRDEVSRRGETDAEHLRVLRLVPELVERAGLGLRPVGEKADRARVLELP